MKKNQFNSKKTDNSKKKKPVKSKSDLLNKGLISKVLLNTALNLNEASYGGNLAFLKRGKIRNIPISPRLINSILEYNSTPYMMGIQLKNVESSLTPCFLPNNFNALFGIATPNEELKAAKERLLDELKRHGIPKALIDILREENKKVHIHNEGDEAGGLTVHESEEGVTFPPGVCIYCGLGGWLVIVYDGHYHIVLKARSAQAIINGDFQGNDHYLTVAAQTLIHELLHVHLIETGCLGTDDQDAEHELIHAIVELIVRRVAADKFRNDGNAQAAHDNDSLGDAARQRAIDAGEEECLRSLGL